MNGLVTVLRAADAAARWHVNQRRKGAAQEPYVTHLLEVAMLVAEATAGADPNLIVAALLHDTIEDQGVTREEIAAQFNDDVADLVVEVTDNKKLPKAERKRLQIEHAPKLTPARQNPQACRQNQQSAVIGYESACRLADAAPYRLCDLDNGSCAGSQRSVRPTRTGIRSGCDPCWAFR